MDTNRQQPRPGWRWLRVIAAAVFVLSLYAGSPCAQGQSPMAEIVGSGVLAGDGFGISMAIDGDWMVVGAPWHDSAGVNAGGAWIFQRQGQDWLECGSLLPVAGSTDAGFGISVAISGDTLAVGAWGDGVGGKEAGAVYTYDWNGSDWTSRGVIRSAQPQVDERFGASVSLSGDSLAVGAYGANDVGPGSGAAYVFQHDGDSWTQEARLTAPVVSSKDYFGWQLAMDGDVLAVGARGHDTPTILNVGAVHVYARTGGQWLAEPSTSICGTEAGDSLGYSVALEGDTLLASAPGAGEGGLAYVYGYSQSAGQWSGEAVLVASDVGEDDVFGHSVALDGDDAVVGAPKKGPNGAAYAFTRSSGQWQTAEAFVAETPAAGRRAGSAVAISDGLAFASAPGDPTSAFGGAVLAFPAGTRTIWQGQAGTAGEWLDANKWSAGVPAPAALAVIDGPEAIVEATDQTVSVGAVELGFAGQAQLIFQNADADLGQLRIGPGGQVSADADSTITISNGLLNASSSPTSLDLGDATVRWEAPGQNEATLEVAGRDLGSVEEGWTDNAAIGKLVVGAGSLLTLADAVDNAEGSGAEALYVGELVLEPGGRVVLGGLGLYFHVGSEIVRLTPGDCDIDGDVDLADLQILSASFGQQGGGWIAGDYDGDGTVGAADYVQLKRHFCSTIAVKGESIVRGESIPEPTTVLLLAAGAAVFGFGSRRRALPRR